MTPAELAAARQRLSAEVVEGVSARRIAGAIGILIIMPGLLLTISGIVSLVVALLFRGGVLLRLLGIAIVRADGAEVSRLRALWRACVAWAPVLIVCGAVAIWARADEAAERVFAARWVVGATIAVVIIGVAYAIRRPAHGLPDGLTGTWLVPRH